MKFSRLVLRCLSSRTSQGAIGVRFLSTGLPAGGGFKGQQGDNSFESADEFERRIFGGSYGNDVGSNSFYRKLNKIEQAHNQSGQKRGEENSSLNIDALDESFNTLSDGIDGKLRQAAAYFEVNPDEIDEQDYSYRPDVESGDGTYELKDLDLTKPGIRRPREEDDELEVTTEEVLKKADFRNVRFLANFITGAGIIIKRSKCGISAKAQRKLAREIKTARAFGLMPFTTMGTKSFAFGRNMENRIEDYQFTNLKRQSDFEEEEDSPEEEEPIE